VNVIEPFRFTPLAAIGELEKLTTTVQFAPGATVALRQLSAPLPNVYCPGTLPDTATAVIVTDAPPAGRVFVNVTVPVALGTDLPWVMVSGFGVIETGDVPVPLSITLAGVTVAPVPATVKVLE
jgi:hypothetical protein